MSKFKLDQKLLTRGFSPFRGFYEFLYVGCRIFYSPTLPSRKATSAALDRVSLTFVTGQEQIFESRDEQQYKNTNNIEEQRDAANHVEITIRDPHNKHLNEEKHRHSLFRRV